MKRAAIAAALLALAVYVSLFASEKQTLSYEPTPIPAGFTIESWDDTCPMNPDTMCRWEGFRRCGPSGTAPDTLGIQANEARYVPGGNGGVCVVPCPGHTYILFCNHPPDDTVASSF